jgi:protein involved in polysaccharide export with SLBB domain
MDRMTTMIHWPTIRDRFAVACRRLSALALLLVVLTSGGCAALSNPVGEGIPVRRVPEEVLGQPREDLKPIPLSALRQLPPDSYRLAAGDVLGVYIEGVLGEKNQPPPVRLPDSGVNVPPSIGYPIPIDEDGKLVLPLVNPIKVEGLTLIETRAAIRKAYLVDKQILPEGRERIIVSLVRPRQYKVQVVRQDSSSVQLANGLALNSRRGTGATVDLAAYENDVLNALNRTGGLPGLDALNEVVIERNIKGEGTKVVHIPLRMRPGKAIPFQTSDIILQNGDIVFIEARDTEVFYTGGLLVPRQIVLPRDYDLRVVDAISLAGGPLVNGGVNQNNLSGNVIQSGLGFPSPSHLSVIRRMAGHGQFTIIVDLNKAMNDSRENILVQPGDVLVLQETPGEALTRYFTNVVRVNFNWIFDQSKRTLGTTTVNGP